MVQHSLYHLLLQSPVVSQWGMVKDLVELLQATKVEEAPRANLDGDEVGSGRGGALYE